MSWPTKSDFCYVWLLGGIHEDRPGYRGFLYTILMSMETLIDEKSTVDRVVMVQLSPESTWTRLDPREERMLQCLGAHILYLDKLTTESFAHLVFDKFRILQFTQYQRVTFLDADLMLQHKVDYLFEQSIGSEPLLGPNLVIATRGEPSNACLFMFQPEQGAWEELQSVMAKHFARAMQLPYPHFDKKVGWGHNFIQTNTYWESIERPEGKRWDYHAAHSDQGLLYYWVRFVKKDCTIIVGNKVQRFKPGPDNVAVKVDEQREVLNRLAVRGTTSFCHDLIAWMCGVPYCNFVHFSGNKKPWVGSYGMNYTIPMPRFFRAGYDVWYDNMRKVNEKLHLGYSLGNDDEIRQFISSFNATPLGEMAWYSDHARKMGEFMNKTTE